MNHNAEHGMGDGPGEQQPSREQRRGKRKLTATLPMNHATQGRTQTWRAAAITGAKKGQTEIDSKLVYEVCPTWLESDLESSSHQGSNGGGVDADEAIGRPGRVQQGP